MGIDYPDIAIQYSPDLSFRLAFRRGEAIFHHDPLLLEPLIETLGRYCPTRRCILFFPAMVSRIERLILIFALAVPTMSTASDVTDRETIPVVGRILFTGDTMLARYIGDEIDRRGDAGYPFRRIGSYLDTFDTVVTNLECPIATGGSDQGERYPFRGEPGALQGLAEAGIDIVNLANNHIFDYGEAAALETLSNLMTHRVAYVGADYTLEGAVTGTIVEYGEVSVAFLGFSNLVASYHRYRGDSFAIAPMEIEIIEEAISRASEKADIVTVQLHWGWEYETTPREEQRRIASKITEAGCDILVGHHPHVVQPFGWESDRYVAYSLGNFIFDQNFSEDTSWGLALEVFVFADGTFAVTPREIAFGRGYQPYIRK